MQEQAQAAGRSLSGSVWRVALGFAGAWLLANLALWTVATSGRAADPAGTLVQKMQFHAEHAGDYDVVFVGDSRTFCAMHPDLIDPALGTRSLNLARWAHWFPTQYPQFEALLPRLDDGTTVVWSLGHQNFRSSGERFHTAYPIGLSNVPFYLGLGFRADDMVDNLLFHHPVTTLIGWLPQLRSSLDARLDRELWSAVPPAPATADELASLLDRVARHSRTARWKVRYDEGRTTSVEVHKTNGAYERIEIDRAFFRQQQAANAAELATAGSADSFEPDPEYWRLFLAILDLFERHDVRLVVNELEEAPYVYGSRAARERIRAFMRERVEPEVRRRGFGYVRADFDRLTDADYFDYNHLNSDGVRAYTALFADAVRRSGAL